MEIVLVGHMQCSIRSSSLATAVPFSMKNPITCFRLSPDVQQSITSVLVTYSRVLRTYLCITVLQEEEFVALNFIVLNLM